MTKLPPFHFPVTVESRQYIQKVCKSTIEGGAHHDSLGSRPRRPRRARNCSRPISFKATIDKLLLWIPSDIVGLYVVGVATLGADDPQVWWLITAIVAAPVIVLLAVAGATNKPTKVKTRATLACIATTLWTLTVPGSGWQTCKAIAENAPTVALVSALAGLIFSLAAAAVVKDN